MSLTDTTDMTSIKVTQDSHKHVAVTRSTGVEFTPPVTHDMVRSLFDPTIKKSFFEMVILTILTSNFILAYYLYVKIGLNFTRNFYLLQYIFWRLSYNVGIGIILHYQSHFEVLNNFTTKHGLFDKKNRSNSKLANLLQFELQSKLPKSKKNDIYSYPDELNVWLIFRQFVDLVLMQDFNTYMIFVFLSLPINNLSKLIQWKSLGGMLLILFNIWVKLDAHRVVKDFAWYWGDFFFLQKDSELIFDGVFNISPHPMYSIGYAGYYGLSLISGDYHVLLVSIIGHLSQFLFLKYVETPHIERTYGEDDGGDESVIDSKGNCGVDDLITRDNYDYSRPLISFGFWLENFDKLRIGDIFTVGCIIGCLSWYLIYSPNNKILFGLTFSIKLISWSLISTILWKQHVSKWFTKLYLSNGYTQVYSYQQWQFLYNFSQSMSYCLLSIQTINSMKLIYITNGNLIKNDMNEILFGFLLITLQIWCNGEIRSAISDFGWFYGDFFLSNYITHKKLTQQGIYKYLNDPETILGVSGVWGTVLMTKFQWENIILATLWTITNFILIKFIERPHLIKLYGDDNANRQSGLQKTLLTMKPIRRVSEIVDNVERMIIRNLLKNNSVATTDQSVMVDSNESLVEVATPKRKDWNDVIEHALFKVSKTIKHNCELKLVSIKDSTILPHEIILHWKIPKDLFNDKDWIGLYKVIDTQNNYKYTTISSNEHWQYVEINSTNIHEEIGEFIEGDITFDHHLLYFEQGIFEFRYHSKGSHRVMSISPTFEIQWPQLNITNLNSFKNSLLKFVEDIECIDIIQGQKYIIFNQKFTVKSLRNLIRDNIGITLNEEYIKNIQGNIDTICNKSWEIKKILDDMY